MNWEKKYYKKAALNKYTEGYRKHIVDFLNTRARDGDSLLEVGCGTGEIVTYLPKNINYTGLDTSRFALDEANKLHGDVLHKFLHIDDKGQFPIGSSTEDFVIAVFSLEHFSNPKGYLTEMIRVLKPSGYLVLLAPNLEFPLAMPNAVRHKSFLWKICFVFLRTIDYLTRIIGILKFRTIEENFTQSTGKYELPDDDLTYVASTAEVVSFLRRSRMKMEHVATPKKLTFWRNAIRFLPGMHNYGTMLFVIAEKQYEKD